MAAAVGPVIRRGLLIAMTAFVPCGTAVVLTNVVFPTREDHDGLWMPLGYLFIGVVFFVAGLTRTSGGSRAAVGAVAGSVFGVLFSATLVVVNNVFLQAVSQQQAKIDGFRESGMASMRAYVNSNILPSTLFFLVEFALLGAALVAWGGAVHDGRRYRDLGP